MVKLTVFRYTDTLSWARTICALTVGQYAKRSSQEASLDHLMAPEGQGQGKGWGLCRTEGVRSVAPGVTSHTSDLLPETILVTGGLHLWQQNNSLPTCSCLGLPLWFCGKESACSAGDISDASSIPGPGRSPGEGNGNPLQ